jgi:hypothetical protein
MLLNYYPLIYFISIMHALVSQVCLRFLFRSRKAPAWHKHAVFSDYLIDYTIGFITAYIHHNHLINELLSQSIGMHALHVCMCLLLRSIILLCLTPLIHLQLQRSGKHIIVCYTVIIWKGNYDYCNVDLFIDNCMCSTFRDGIASCNLSERAMVKKCLSCAQKYAVMQ